MQACRQIPIEHLPCAPRRRRGASMIEVLVTLVIVSFGLLGLVGLQSRLQVAEMESYQRAQALVLLNDMSSRMTVNRAATLAGSYDTSALSPAALGTGMTCPAAAGGDTVQQADSREWCAALQGAAELIGSSKIGALIGGRGCITPTSTTNGAGQTVEYLITVAWQGLTPLSAPPSSVTCGSGSYDGTGACTSDRCRRVVTTLVRVG